MSPLEDPAAELERIYSQRFDAMSAYRNSIWTVLTKDFFQRYIPGDAHILDLGCGYGEFINNIGAAKKFGMDLNPNARKHLNTGITLIEQDCSTTWPLADGSLDVVFTSNFFEHLPDKAALRRTLSEIHRCLKPGGKLIALGPNIRFLPGSYWDFWDHYLPLTELSLAEGLTNLGYTIHTQLDRFLPYTMARGRQAPVGFLKLYLKLSFFWRFFGKQFLVIAQKE